MRLRVEVCLSWLLLRCLPLFFRKSKAETVGPLHGAKAKLRFAGGARRVSCDHNFVSISKGVILNAAVRQLGRSRPFYAPPDLLAFVVGNLDGDERMRIAKGEHDNLTFDLDRLCLVIGRRKRMVSV